MSATLTTVQARLFNKLTIIGDAIGEEDQAVYLFASIQDSFNTLVTALESKKDIPQMEVVMEKLLHTERKQNES